MKEKKLLTSVVLGSLILALLLSLTPGVFAATGHYANSHDLAGDDWEAYSQSWEDIAQDYTKVAITVGANQNELNFAWYSKADAAATPVVHFGKDADHMEAFEGTSGEVEEALTLGEKYHYNHVTVTGVEENTEYVYTVEKNGEETEPVSYKSGSFSEISFMFCGDPQIGASKGQPQAGEDLVAEDGVANTAARNDAYAWNRTLEIALKENPELNFIFSAGDQVNKTGKPKEEEYAGFLNAGALAGMPLACVIGNHDSLTPDHAYHFNTANSLDYGKTQAGGDSYFCYGPALFILLNTNNYNAAEHEAAVKEAVEAHPEAKWRIVGIHQDVYGSGLDHSMTDGMVLRTQLTPIFDAYKIDVVLQGHDHQYNRTHILKADGQDHGNYEFRLNAEGTGYDWGHAFNLDTDEAIPLYPEENDKEGAELLDQFHQDNLCYTMSEVDGQKVNDPDGTLYIESNSASGSKFYELNPEQQDYIAVRSQNWLPSYSIVKVNEHEFSIVTYQITDEGKVEVIDELFTIEKTAEAAQAA